MISKRKAIDLLSGKRFDILAKYIYAKYRHIESDFPLDIYRHHLQVWNNCNEITDASKSNFEDFKREFDNIIDSIANRGFDPEISRVPLVAGNLANGAHRVAASILYNKDVCCVAGVPTDGQVECGYDFFRNRNVYVPTGIDSSYADRMAMEYCNLKDDTFIVTIFPSAPGSTEVARRLLSSCCDIIYEKRFELDNNGPFNFIRTLYDGEWWIGTRQNMYQGVYPKMDLCYDGGSGGETIAFLVECSDSRILPEIKEKIRTVYGIGKHSVHINDTREETLRISRAIFNDNSIHFMNNSKKNFYDNFERCFEKYTKWVKDKGVNADDLCVDSSAVLSAYGIRDCRDLDFLYAGKHIDTGMLDVSCHNEEMKHYTHTKDDIIYNPSRHFYYRGMKFSSIQTVQEMKQNRGEQKDFADCELIKEIK